jgi:hypothetical protein
MKPLGSHQDGFNMVALKENTGFLILLNYVSTFLYWKFDIMRLFTSIALIHCHIACITPIFISSHYFALERSFNPLTRTLLCKTKKLQDGGPTPCSSNSSETTLAQPPFPASV